MRFPALVESFRARLLLLLALMLGLTLGIQYYFNLRSVKANAKMITSAMRGAFRSDPRTRAEFMGHVDRSHDHE